MAVRTKITSKGIISELVTSNPTGPATGISPFSLPENQVTANSSLTEPGNYAVSGSSALTITMNNPNTNGASLWLFRAESAHAHVVSGTGFNFTDGTSVGGQVALGGTENDSVVLMSDGFSYLVLGNSGSLTLS